MKKLERIKALNIALKYDIKVKRCWWSPFQNVTWEILNSNKKLSTNQYAYLSNNDLLKVKEEITEGEVIIMTISDKGKLKLQSLS